MTSILLAPRKRLGIPRHDGSLATLAPGTWASDVLASKPGRRILVHFCCPDCGGRYELDCNDINASGEVGEEFICQTFRCESQPWLLTLSGWGLPTFDNSDVNE